MADTNEEIAVLRKWDRVNEIADRAANKMGEQIQADQRIEQLKKDVDELKTQISKSNGEVRTDLEARAHETNAKLEEAIALMASSGPTVSQTIRCTGPSCKAILKLPPTSKAGDSVKCGRCRREMKLKGRSA